MLSEGITVLTDPEHVVAKISTRLIGRVEEIEEVVEEEEEEAEAEAPEAAPSSEEEPK